MTTVTARGATATTPGAYPPARLGLLTALGPPPAWAALVEALAVWCEPVATRPGEPGVVAWLASSPQARHLPAARRLGLPVAVMETGDAGTAVVVSPDRDHTRPAQRVPVPVPGIRASQAWPVAPFVRARWRRRLGLPAGWTVAVADLDADLLDTALALAAAVVVPGELLLGALSWGQACVTTAEGARAVGAADGVEAVVAASGEPAELAAELAGDERRAACLGRRGRRLVERHHDLDLAAARLARLLGLAPPVAGPAAAARRHLDELRTPAGSPVRARVAAALVAPTPGPPGGPR